MKYFGISLFLIAICVSNCFGEAQWPSRFGRAPLLERFSWKQLDWAYPDEISRRNAIDSGDYQPQNALPVGIQKWRNKLFVTVPRWKDGEFFFFIFI